VANAQRFLTPATTIIFDTPVLARGYCPKVAVSAGCSERQHGNIEAKDHDAA
jgi:hypothetical protein